MDFRQLLILLSFFPSWSLLAQEGAANEGAGLLLGISYSYQIPGGDLADRFGNNFNLGGNIDFIPREHNWIIGLQGQFLFGSEVKNDVLAALRTAEGLIYGNNKSVADIQLRERGFYAGLHAGKLISLGTENPRAGLRLTLGGGLLQHKIRIQEDPISRVPQLEGDYKKGYDRLTNGFALQQFLGYQLLGREGRINFYAGLECTQAFTQNRRAINFDTGTAESGSRLDLLFGVRVGWILPFYLKKADEIYY